MQTKKKLLIAPALLVAGALAFAGCSATPDAGPSKAVGTPISSPSPTSTYDAEEFREAIDKVVAATEQLVEEAEKAEAEKLAEQ